MKGFTPESFGDLNAADYDQAHDPGTTEQTVAMLHQLCPQGRVLELAIGSGRIALPLAARGPSVSGIEASQKMVDLMRAKPGGQDTPVTLGDMADVEADGPFDLIFLVYNTIYNLLTQEAQIRLFANVAKQLRPGGHFLVEAFVPDFSGFQDNRKTSHKNLTMEGVWIDAITHHPAEQRLDYQRIRYGAGGVKLVPFAMRYIWPAEMDLMARLAGLEAQARWSDWDQSPFDSRSTVNISLYRKPS